MSRHYVSFHALCTLLLFAAASSADPDISWVAIAADGPFRLAGSNGVGDPTEIILVAGLGYRVEFQLRVSGWADAPGFPTLSMVQATLDPDGLLGANAVPPKPGVDLELASEAPYYQYTGWYKQLRSCITFSNVETGQRCDTLVPPLPPCPPGTFCGDNPDYVLAGILITDDYWPYPVLGALSNVGHCRTDAGISYYVGTFKFDVPAEAIGTYSFGFDPDPSASILHDCAYSTIPGLIFTPGFVTITPSCCLPDRSCESLVEAECLAAGGTLAGGFCTDDADGDGAADACDGCPDDPGLFAPGPCGCDSTDTDGDGTQDCVDACPNDPLKSEDGGVCGCGVPDVDSDGDGVLDCHDRCPGHDDATAGPDCPVAIPGASRWGMATLVIVLAAALGARFRHRGVEQR